MKNRIYRIAVDIIVLGAIGGLLLLVENWEARMLLGVPLGYTAGRLVRWALPPTP